MSKINISLCLLFVFCFISNTILAQTIITTPNQKLGAEAYTDIIHSPDDKFLFASTDENIVCWDRENDNIRRVIAKNQSKVLSLDYNPVLGNIASGNAEGIVNIWGLSGKKMLTLKGHTGSIRTVKFSADGKFVAAGSDDKTIKVWSVQSGSLITTFKGHTKKINDLQFALNNTYILSAGEDGSVKMWNLTQNKLEKTLYNHHRPLVALDFSDHGKKKRDKWICVGSKDGKAIIFNLLDTDNLIHSFDGHKGSVNKVQLINKGKQLLTVSGNHSVVVWNTKSKKKEVSTATHKGEITGFSLTKDDKTLATCSKDKTVKIWKLKTGELEQTLTWNKSSLTGIDFSKDGKYILTTSFDNTAKLWDAEKGKYLQTFKLPKGRLNKAIFIPNKSELLTGFDEKAIAWKYDGRKAGEYLGHEELLYSLASSKDGKYVLTGSADKTVKVWDTESKKTIGSFIGHSKLVSALAFSNDGKHIATGASDRSIRIWEIIGQKQQKMLTGHLSSIQSLHYSPDDKYIISSSGDKKAKVWETKTGNELFTLNHTNSVRSAVFSPNGKYLLTSAADKTARVWDSETGKELIRIKANAPLVGACFSPDGKKVVVGSSDGYIYVYNIKIEPELIVSNLRFETESKQDTLKGTERGRIVFELENRGVGEAVGVKASVALKSNIQGIQIQSAPAIGALATKQTRTISIPVTTNQNLETGIAVFEVKIEEKNGFSPKLGSVSTPTEMLPELPIEVDCNFFTSKKINKMELGNSITLKLMLKNASNNLKISKGKVTFEIKNHGGEVFPPKKTFDLASLKKNGTTLQEFKFMASEDFDKDAIDITFSVEGTVDGKKKTRPYNDQFSITMGEALFPPSYNCQEDVANILWIDPDPVYYSLKGMVSETEKMDVSLKILGDENVTEKNVKLKINGKIAREGGKLGNAKLIRPKSASRAKKTYFTYRRNVELQRGENIIQIVVENGAETIESEPFRVHYAAGKPSLHVLSIGTNPGDLKYTTKDARDFANAWQSQINLPQSLFSRITVDSLFGVEATASKIKVAIESFRQKYTLKEFAANDVLVVFLSSHGFIQDEKFYIQGSDFDPFGPTSTSVAYKDLTDMLEPLPMKTLFLIDACHSGASGGKALESEISKAINQNISLTPGIIPMSSSSESELSYEDDSWQNGAFTEAILKAFNTNEADKDRNGILTVQELFDFVTADVSNMVRKVKSAKQTPQLHKNDKELEKLGIYILR